MYGCLVEAYTYMKGEADILAEYNKRFSEAVIALKMFGEAKEPQDIYRTGQVIRQRQ